MAALGTLAALCVKDSSRQIVWYLGPNCSTFSIRACPVELSLHLDAFGIFKRKGIAKFSSQRFYRFQFRLQDGQQTKVQQKWKNWCLSTEHPALLIPHRWGTNLSRTHASPSLVGFGSHKGTSQSFKDQRSKSAHCTGLVLMSIAECNTERKLVITRVDLCNLEPQTQVVYPTAMSKMRAPKGSWLFEMFYVPSNCECAA